VALREKSEAIGQQWSYVIAVHLSSAARLGVAFGITVLSELSVLNDY
jgi:hypothetical protein